MVDNRAAGFYGVAGAFNFKSGDISGTAAKTSDDRASQGTEYGQVNAEEEEQQAVNGNKYVDNSAQLNATLSSLAMMNVASVINSKLPKFNRYQDFRKLLEEAEEIVSSISADDDRESKKEKKEEKNSQSEEDDDNEYY
ncbi:MAG: hypothetical protein NC200_04790 [Candidatus Gastranaerophilales bacterium]|nr:hypothetical protein [Candidatus Gastranaerophilales bacterium]